MEVETQLVELTNYKEPLLSKVKWAVKDRIRQYRLNKMRKLLVKLSDDSHCVDHCKRELHDWYQEEDGPNKWMAEGTEDLIRLFSTQGHSGSSAPFAIEVFKTLAQYEPWGPLTGAESEWAEPYEFNGTQQNKRCGTVFRDADGRAYNIDGKIFRELNGCCFTSKDSRVYIEFPYTPKSEYVDVPLQE